MGLGIGFFVAGELIGRSFWENFLFAIGIIVANVPEGLLPTVTLSLSIASQRMAKKNALVKRLSSVETLGSATVICTDKTGTITQNRISLEDIYIPSRSFKITEAKPDELFLSAILCNNAKTNDNKVVGEPTETALLLGATRIMGNVQNEWERVDEIAFTSERKMMSTVNRKENRLVLYSKGAPEVILAKCTRILIHGSVKTLTVDDKQRIEAQVSEYAGSLYALGFGAYCGLLLETYHIDVFGLQGDSLIKFLAVIIALVFIYINYLGASETGAIANIVGLFKIAILAVFIISGLYTIYYKPDWFSNFNPFLPNGMGGIFMAMGLTFIAFEGYEVIAQTAEEVKNPKKNIPKAIFLSLLIVVPIYLLVAFVSIGALTTDIPSWQFLGQHKELGLLEAARQFMPFGTFLLLVAGLVSTMSALNATTFSSTRVSFAMGRDHNLPSIFKKIHPVNRTPYAALFISGALIIIMAVSLPIEHVASAADIMFLLLFLQVNIAVIKIRNKFGKELDYGYKMPFFPVIPILGIITQLFLAIYMFNYSPLGWYATIIWIALGVLVYFGYSVGKEKVEKGKKARQLSPGDYRIVVPSPSRRTLNLSSPLAQA